MAVKKKQAKKTKKEIVKKQKANMVVENKAAEEKKPKLPEVQQNVSKQEQTPVSESIAQPTVIPSGVIEDTPKEEPPQLETVSPKVDQPESLPQPLQQAKDTLVSQPESATSIPVESEVNTTQDSLAISGVVRDTQTQETEQHIDEPKKKRLWTVISIAIFLVLIGGALWYFRESVLKKASLQDEITPTPSFLKNTPTPASDSAKLVIDYSKYKIQVLNGSGISGAAAKAKNILESEKFIVRQIGNAETSDYEKTVIQAKKEVPSAFLDKLESVLEESYLLDADEELEDSEEVDVIIIIGSSKQP